MAVQLLKFRALANGSFLLVIWLDDTGDPLNTVTFTYAPVPQGVTQNVYLTQIRQETKRLVQRMLAAPDDGTPLNGEGTTL